MTARPAREPLVTFLILTVALFGAHALIPGRSSAKPDEIVVTHSRMRSLASDFEQMWQRSPSASELDDLASSYVRDEICAREARVLGLGQDDVVIRRRLRQMMELSADAQPSAAEPTDTELTRWLEAHQDRFREDSRLTFEQIFLDPTRHGDRLRADAEALATRLQNASAPIDLDAYGDPLLLPHTYEAEPLGEIAKAFGPSFARAVDQLPAARWTGPIPSGLGAHVVRLVRRVEGRPAVLRDVRAAVLRDWENTRKQEARESFYGRLLRRYTVTVER